MRHRNEVAELAESSAIGNQCLVTAKNEGLAGWLVCSL